MAYFIGLYEKSGEFKNDEGQLISFHNSLFGIANDILDTLPDVQPLVIPDGVEDGINTIFSCLGWIMPVNLYLPLITFILGLTAFRIAYAVYIHIFKR